LTSLSLRIIISLLSGRWEITNWKFVIPYLVFWVDLVLDTCGFQRALLLCLYRKNPDLFNKELTQKSGITEPKIYKYKKFLKRKRLIWYLWRLICGCWRGAHVEAKPRAC
jgi:hypothetical protein